MMNETEKVEIWILNIQCGNSHSGRPTSLVCSRSCRLENSLGCSRIRYDIGGKLVAVPYEESQIKKRD